MYPKIIPQETYEAVRKIVNKNKYGKRSTKTVYLLRHKVVCGNCGRPVSAETGTARNGEVIHYYKCIGRKKDRNGCTLSAIHKEQLENLVVDTVTDELCKSEIMDAIVANIMRMQESRMTENITLKLLTKEKAATDRALNNLVNAIEQGIISNTTNKRLHELEEQQENLERQLLIEHSRLSVKISEKMIRDYYAQALKSEPQLLINNFVKKVVLFETHIEIYLNSPLKTGSDDDRRDFSFAKKLWRLGRYKILVIIKITI